MSLMAKGIEADLLYVDDYTMKAIEETKAKMGKNGKWECVLEFKGQEAKPPRMYLLFVRKMTPLEVLILGF